MTSTKRLLLHVWGLFTAFAAASAAPSHAAPIDFCAATSAHQIEGQNVASDWWRFEQLPDRIKNGDRSGRATDHLNRFREDIALMQELGVQRYRFSIEWARVEPEEGSYDATAIQWYRNLVQELNRAGIRPLITLHHFTLPEWFRRKGGWESADAPEAFNRFVEKSVREIAPEAPDWVTFNEPMVHLVGGYVAGIIPPEAKDFSRFKVALSGILKSHAKAYQTLHRESKAPDVRVGVAHHLRIFEGARAWNPIDYLAAFFIDRAWNWAFIDALESGEIDIWVPGAISFVERIDGLKGSQDFLGINYYSRDQVKYTGEKPMGIVLSAKEGSPKTDLGWEIYPNGLADLLVESANRYSRLPIVITENGIADAGMNDVKRVKFIRDHLVAVRMAARAGAKVEAYCYWSLIDNFEWNEGFEPRFGLFHVDYSTFKRTPRQSVGWFKKAIRKFRELYSSDDQKSQ